MPRSGKIAKMNPKRGMIAIHTEDNGYTIIELLSDWDVELGDEIYWENDYALGSEVYENRTKQSRSEVYVQNHAVGPAILREQLRL